MQTQLNKIDLLTQNLETNFHIRLNNRFGVLSARLHDFQSDIEKYPNSQFFAMNFLVFDVMFEWISMIFVNQLGSVRIHPIRLLLDPHRGSFSRATSEWGTVDFSPICHNYPLFTQNSCNSSPISVLSHESVSSYFSSDCAVLMATSLFPCGLDLSLKQFEPKGTILDVESCKNFLRDFHCYKDFGGSKHLSTLLQVP